MRRLSLLLIPALFTACNIRSKGGGASDTAQDTAGSGQPGSGDTDTDADADVDPDADTDSDTGTDTDSDTDSESGGCNTADGVLPEGLVELAYDDGAGLYSIEPQGWSVGDLALTAPLHEQVAFELEGPARVYGFAVQFAGDGVEGRAVTAGLYPDFGYNGFDMWHFAPTWEGSRCPEDVRAGQWVTFAFEEPVEIEQPGLVYVGHLRQDADDPEWLFDATYRDDGNCVSWGECRSAINLPDEQILIYNGSSYYYWPGFTLSFQYDFMVRLYVEYTGELAAEDRVFQPVEGVSGSARSAWGDYDNDGYDDLLVTGPRLYHNEGDGSFADVTASAGLSGVSVSGGIWGDYNNDGCLDLFAFAESYSVGDTLLRGDCEGNFTDVTAASGITDVQSYNGCSGGYENTPTPAAAWWDIDSDGLLDLYLSNFICWDDYSYYTDTVWHNEGEVDGEVLFAGWTGERGFRSLDDEALAGRGASPIDHDRDGDVDLLVSNYVLHPNLLYDNQGDGTVLEAAEDAGLAGEAVDFYGYIYYGHTIGAAWGDLDGDGTFDVVEANLAHPRYFDFSDKTRVLLGDGSGGYVDIQGDWSAPRGDAGLRYQETHSVPMLGDFDQDGALDLVVSAVYEGRPTDFYWGAGDGTFTLDTYTTGITTLGGWGVAAADYDNDGDLDIASGDFLFQNGLDEAEKGSWLQVRVVGNAGSNAAGIGATVEVIAGDRAWLRHVGGGTGQGDQDSLTLHFGLGEVAEVDELRVTFPGGDELSFSGPFAVDQRLWLYEDGRHGAGWTAPGGG